MQFPASPGRREQSGLPRVGPTLRPDAERGAHLVDLARAAAPGPQADHAERGREAQRAEEDVLPTVTCADLLEQIKAKLGICCDERVHCESDDCLKQTRKQNKREKTDHQGCGSTAVASDTQDTAAHH